MNRTSSLMIQMRATLCIVALGAALPFGLHADLTTDGPSFDPKESEDKRVSERRNVEASVAEPILDVSETLRLLEETAAILDLVLELEKEADGKSTEESIELRNKMTLEFRRLDLESIKLPEGVLMSDDELIQRATRAIEARPRRLPGPDFKELPPVVGFSNSVREVTFPIQRPDGSTVRTSSRFFVVRLHPTSGQVITISR